MTVGHKQTLSKLLKTVDFIYNSIEINICRYDCMFGYVKR